jgi:phage tail sheath protein FI
MAERILSPGVFSRENDLSFLTPAPAEISTAVVGPTVKGPIDIPTVVRSYGEYKNVFGETFLSGSDYYAHFTALAAERYFDQGGTSLLVTRVSDDSFTPASATVANDTLSNDLFKLETLAEGEIMNSAGGTGANNALTNGTSDNIRWEITSVNATLGTFSLVIRRGDDNDKNKVILESFSKLSLDPKSENYINKVIGDQVESNSGGVITMTGDYPNKSRYIRAAAIYKMPDYFDNNGVAKSAYSTVLADLSAKDGAFGGATGALFQSGVAASFYQDAPNASSEDSQGIDVSATSTAYDNALAALANKDQYRFNVLMTPGINQDVNASLVGSFIDMVEDRGDAIYVADLVGHGAPSVSTVTAEAGYANSSYAAAYWPWVKVYSQGLGKDVWAPASTVMGGVYAFNDRVGAEWFAPAGLMRGGIPGVTAAERKLSQANRDELYLGKVNPIATFPGSGIVAYGQKTLQTKASALDRVNVRRLLISLKNFIGDQANNLVFEQNTIATRNKFLSLVNPYLETVVQRQGLYAYRVVMDDTNNSADVIDRNQLVGQIYIQPTKTAEFIVLDFVVQPTGASFGA